MGYLIERRIIKSIKLMPLKSKDYIIAHEAGNPNNTGDNSLESEVKYMTNNWRKAFTHFWVGNKAIVQLAEDGFLAYGAGGYMNPHSPVQVEVARVDTKEEFDEAYKRYIWLLRYMADKYGIPKTLDSNDRRGIKTHEWVTKNLGGTTHTDPYAYFEKWGVTRAQFKRDVENGIVDKKVVVDKDKYRLVTGTFIGKVEAEKQAAKLRKDRGWLVYVQKE